MAITDQGRAAVLRLDHSYTLNRIEFPIPPSLAFDGVQVMAKRAIVLDDNQYDQEIVQFRFDAGGPIALRELAASFDAIDKIYTKTTNGEERLAVTELRSGSIIAIVEPFIPFLGQGMQALNAAITLTDFTKLMKSAIDTFSGLKARIVGDEEPDDVGNIAAEIAELVRPLSAKAGASLEFSRIRISSQTKKRTVEVEALYSSAEIDRALINADRHGNEKSLLRLVDVNHDDAPTLMRKVTLHLQQANSGPAREKGQTGDKGIIEVVSDKALPIYFAKGIGRLKEKMVKGTKNPLLQTYTVDGIVTRENGQPKSFTVIDLQAAPGRKKTTTLPLLDASQQKPATRGPSQKASKR